MPKDTPDTRKALRQLLTASAEEWIDPAGLRGLLGPAPVWTPRLTPFFTLLQELLADLFTVRDRVLAAQARGRKPPRLLDGQYERDRQWISSQDDRVPFSFGWVCVVLGLSPSAVRRRYLSGQPSAFARHTAVLRARKGGQQQG